MCRSEHFYSFCFYLEFQSISLLHLSNALCLGGEVRDLTRNTNSLLAAIGVLNARDIESDDLRSGLGIKLEILDASGNDRGFIEDHDVVGI